MEKIIEDHFICKIGEEAVKIVFQNLAKKVMEPDYEIYQVKQKTWDEALKIDDVPIAVKTQKNLPLCSTVCHGHFKVLHIGMTLF